LRTSLPGEISGGIEGWRISPFAAFFFNAREFYEVRKVDVGICSGNRKNGILVDVAVWSDACGSRKVGQKIGGSDVRAAWVLCKDRD
jgi:hypothetical protein